MRRTCDCSCSVLLQSCFWTFQFFSPLISVIASSLRIITLTLKSTDSHEKSLSSISRNPKVSFHYCIINIYKKQYHLKFENEELKLKQLMLFYLMQTFLLFDYLTFIHKSSPSVHLRKWCSVVEKQKLILFQGLIEQFLKAVRNFVQSFAAYSIICYVLQVKDR